MSSVLFIIGALVLSGVVRANAAFGRTADEMGYLLGIGLWLLAFMAWVVERFTRGGDE